MRQMPAALLLLGGAGWPALTATGVGTGVAGAVALCFGGAAAPGAGAAAGIGAPARSDDELVSSVDAPLRMNTFLGGGGGT